MKRQLLGIITIIGGLLALGSTFAQVPEYTDCAKNANGIFACQEYQTCNNPDGICVCNQNQLYIPHNTTCLGNNTLIKNRVISSFAISGSTVVFKFKIQNNSTAKYFEVKLPPSYNNPRIKITDLTSDGLTNGGLIALNNGFGNPKYLIGASTTKTIIVTGEIASSSFLFDTIETSACIRNIGSSTCIDEPFTYILPTSNYNITQKILDPKPIFSTEKAIYEVKVQNNGSKSNSDVVTLNTMLGNFLGQPTLTIQKKASIAQEPNNNIYSWELGIINPGETKTYTITTPLTSTPPAGSVIITTGSITAGRELQSFDNTAVTTYTVPTVIDLSLDSIQKISGDPEIDGDEIGFAIKYTNKGNSLAQTVSLKYQTSNIDTIPKTISLPNLNGETSNTIYITGLVNQTYPVGTKFCFSGTISASNETESTSNNNLSDICYTFVKSADITIEANLTNSINTINSGSELIYEVKIANKGEKTASGINLSFYPSANQKIGSAKKGDVLSDIYNSTRHFAASLFDEAEHQLETAEDIVLDDTTEKTFTTIYTGSLTNITLLGGEEKIIYYKTILTSYPITGISISLSGEALFNGIELDKTNNNFSISYALPGLSDVYISHTMLPFSGFKAGDKVTYIITYGNSGFASAWNPVVNLTLPSSIEADQTSWNLGKSISAGDSGTIVVTGTLKQFLAAGTEFSSQARISTDSSQVTTNNDISLITGTVASYDNITFGFSAQNTTRPMLTINPTTLVRAVSGDIISFTITYVNNGNVPAQNTTILFTNLGSLVLDAYNGNLGTIGVNEQGTITINGRIVGSRFSSFTPTVTINYNNTTTSYSITIEEPYECGDGLITQNEVCDTGVPLDPQSGLECQNQQGICTLVTKWISNIACIQTLDLTEVCSNQAIINLNQPTCKTLEVNKPSANSDSISARCFGEDTSAYTPVSINCGNGTTYTGVMGVLPWFERTCSYDSSEQADEAIVSCAVANDINNSDCRKTIPSCEIDIDGRVVILEENEGSIEVECSTLNGQEAVLEIDCGNGDRESAYDNIFSHTCEYNEDDLDGDASQILDIKCSVNDTVSCEDDIILDQGIMGICGDGVRQGYEQCDLPNGTEINRHLDEQNEYDASSSVRGKVCYNCSIEDEAPAQCLSVHNGNISIEKGEYLPFWWRVNSASFASTDDCSRSSDKGKIIKSTMECTFEIQKPGEAGEQEVKEILTRECISNPGSEYKIFNYFNQYMSSSAWKYAVKPDIFNSWVDNDLGEYKLRLKNVEYEYCDEDNEIQESQTDNVCETNFTITKPYLVQKSAFGITPKSTTIDLRNFYDINGNDLVTRTDLADVMVLNESEYGGNSTDLIMYDFVNKMEKLAVTTTAPRGLNLQGITAKKVPNKDIYILYGNGSPITVKKDATITKPFTLIIKNATLIIDGNIDVNGMFVVQNGTIRFDDTSCIEPQIVKGIFVANNFTATKNVNDSLYKERCNAGGLHVKGVLIGGGIENLVNNKRSNLSKWFRVSGSDTTVKVQRRNMIFNGASVLIEYSPELRQQLPPGADEFTQALDVYKK